MNASKVRRFLSDDHFSVDGTLVEAWASLKSFRAKDGDGEPPAPGRNGGRDYHGGKRSNETHASTTDPDAMLYRPGAPHHVQDRAEHLATYDESAPGRREALATLALLRRVIGQRQAQRPKPGF